MGCYYESGYKAIQLIQTWQHPLLDWFFAAVSALGVKEFYLVAIPFVYWCVDKSFGARLCFIFLSGILLNMWVKEFVHTVRPDATRVRVVFPESGGGYSFPSGHAQGSVAFWGYCMAWVKRTWFSVFSVIFIAVMFLSRMYLGLHYPWDLLGGVCLGLLTLIFFFVLLVCYGRIKNQVPWPVWLIAIGTSTVILAWLFPASKFGMVSGGFLGFFGGVVLEKQFVAIRIRKELPVQRNKLLLGVPVGLVVLNSVVMGLAGWKNAPFLGYALAGLWVSLGAPWCFKKLRWG